MEELSTGQKALENSLKNLIRDLDEPSREKALHLAADLLDYMRNQMMAGPEGSGSSSSTPATITINCPHPTCGLPIKISLS